MHVSSIPTDFQQALTRVKHLLVNMIQMDTCVNDHYMFTDGQTDCPICQEPRFTSTGLVRRAGFYVHPRDWLRTVLAVPKLYNYFSYMREYIEEEKHRGGVNEKRDFLSGSIVQDVIIDYINSRGGDFFKTALCGICFDAVEISRWPKKSITPILCTWFNVPP